MEDHRYGKTHDYTPRRGIRASGVSVPPQAPAWASDRELLWNKLESFEKRKDAQLAREIVIGLPHQLSEADHHALLEEFIRNELSPYGLAADWAIHDANRAGDHRNAHAHILVTLRALTPDGFSETKDRTLNSRDRLGQWREAWARIQNAAFERHGISGADGEQLRVDHRSYEDQGLDLEPTQHMGVHATAMERRGLQTEIGEINRDIVALNAHRRTKRKGGRKDMHSTTITHQGNAVGRLMDFKRRIAERTRESEFDP